jgi:hypothetical protein
MLSVLGGTMSGKLKSHNMTTAGPVFFSSPIVKSDSGYQTPISKVPGESRGAYVHRVPCNFDGISMSLEMIVCVFLFWFIS